MYIIVRDDKIVTAFSKVNISLDEIKESYPDCKCVEKSIGINPLNIHSLARIYKGDVIKKISASITLDKEKINADGEDELNVLVEVYDLHPDEEIKHIMIGIEGATIPVPINNNIGSVIISSKTPGLHMVEIVSPSGIIYLKKGFHAE